MNFQQLLKSVSWIDVWETLIENYPDQVELKDEYYRTFSRCRIGELASTKMRICVSKVNPQEWELEIDPESEPWVDVGGRDGTLNKDTDEYKEGHFIYGEENANEEVHYGIEFTPWNEWIAMTIDPISFEDFSEIEIAAHCLWEMTFISFDEIEVEDQLDGLKETMERIERGEEKLIPMDEAFKKFSDRISDKGNPEENDEADG